MQPYFGVYPAFVVDNVDPLMSGRVEVQLAQQVDPLVQNNAAWAQIATLMAGNQRGTWFIPDIGDEVLVAFEGGDPDRPYVIGALWNSKDSPPEKMDPANNLKTIRSRKGVKVTFNDQDGQESLTIETPGGQSITLQDNTASISITASSGSLIILGAAGVGITSGARVVITAAVVEINAGMLTVNGGMSQFSGVVKCNTLIANSVISSSYSPAAGNIF